MRRQSSPQRDESPLSSAHKAGPVYTSGLSRAAPAQELEARGRRRTARSSNSAVTTMPAGKVLLAGIVGLIVAALLNADALVRDAERMEFGTTRDVSLAVWEPVQAISSALGLTEPRRIADEALGREFGSEELFDALPDPASTGPQAATTLLPGSAESSIPEVVTPPSSSASTTIATTTTTITTTTTLLSPTLADPLTLWVGGDSMAQVFGESLVRLGADTNIIDPTLSYRISSGLTRPDFFNWAARLSDVVSNDDPDVMVVIFGANDAQGMELSTGIFQPFEDEWVAEYTSRVSAAMDILTRGSDRVVVWVGQPIMRSERFDVRMNRLNEVYLEQAALRDQIVYLDTRPLFADNNGEYEPFQRALDGETRNMRQQDGTHLSRAGGDVLADIILDILGEHIDLVSGRVPVTTEP